MIQVVAWLAGGFLLITALLKAFYSQLFIVHVRRFKLIPERPAALLAILFIELEAGLGLALILGIYLNWLVPMVMGLLGSFTVLTLWAKKIRQIDDCGCYGGLIRFNTRTSTLINLSIFSMLSVSFFFSEASSSANPRRLYAVIILVLLVHLVAKKTVKRPLVDILRLSTGKPWNQKLYDLSTHSESNRRFLFIILDVRCTVCFSWLKRLGKINQSDIKDWLVIILMNDTMKTKLESEDFALTFATPTISEQYIRLLSGQLPMAIWVEDGLIVHKKTGTFPENDIFNPDL